MDLPLPKLRAMRAGSGTPGPVPKSRPRVLRHGGKTASVEAPAEAVTLNVIDRGNGAHDPMRALVALAGAGRSGRLRGSGADA
jgi:hypothetical protein